VATQAALVAATKVAEGERHTVAALHKTLGNDRKMALALWQTYMADLMTRFKDAELTDLQQTTDLSDAVWYATILRTQAVAQRLSARSCSIM